MTILNRFALCSIVFPLAATIWIDSTVAQDRPNVLLICVDDLRPELNCFGVEYIHSPNIDRLAASGVAFTRHYVQAPTCGASRMAMLTGQYGSASNNALFQRAEKIAAGKAIAPSLPAWFREHGYTTVSVGKVSHHPGGRGGRDWNDDEKHEMPKSWDRSLLTAGQWQHPRGWMHGLANGEIRRNSGGMDVFQSAAGEDSIYPDGISTETALKEMDGLAGDVSKPFFLAVGILRPHLPFGAPAKYMKHYEDTSLPAIPHPGRPEGKTTFHKSGEFMKYNRWGRDPNADADFAVAVRKHYAACVSFADAQVGRLLAQLEKSPAAKNTIVVLWGDHGWHLGEHSIWGKHTLFEESLRSPLVIKYPGLTNAGAKSDQIVESVDLFPTLCELAKVPVDEEHDFLVGRSLVPLMNGKASKARNAIGYFGKARTIRTESYRLIKHDGGHVELYDHNSDELEAKNVAEQNPKLVEDLLGELNRRHPE